MWRGEREQGGTGRSRGGEGRNKARLRGKGGIKWTIPVKRRTKVDKVTFLGIPGHGLRVKEGGRRCGRDEKISYGED